MDDQSAPPKLPGFELLRRIGRGASGEVWLARSVTGALRAVKLVFRRNFDTERDYEREFRGLRKFEPVSRTHASQMDVFHVDRRDDEGYYYYAMELADDLERGLEFACEDYQPRTLRSDLLKRPRLPMDEVLELGIRLATALAHLHEHELIHRDIKPSNVIFVSGSPKLADVGLVARRDDTLSLVGTLGYTPNEGPGTERADIFSLGKVLYEAGTGKDCRQFPEPPTEIGDGREAALAFELNEIVLRTCAPDPANRYASARELLDDLLLVQSGRSVRRLRRMERRLVRLRRVGVMAVIVAGLSVLAFVHQQRQAKQLQALSDENRRHLVRMHVREGVQLLEQKDNLRSLPWLVRSLELEAGSPDREFVHRTRIAQVLRHGPKLVGLGTHPRGILAAALSQDGRRLITAGRDGTARVWSTDTATEVTSALEHGDYVTCVLLSPDETLVATGSDDNTARLWDVHTGEPIGPPLPHSDSVLDLAFSPDGRLLATAGADHRARLWRVVDGQPVGEPLIHSNRVNSAAFDTDGRRLATGDRSGLAFVWESATGRHLLGPLTHPQQVGEVRFAVDGGLWTACDDGGLRLWNLEDGSLQLPVLRHQGRVYGFAISPDNRQIVATAGTIGRHGELRVWDARNGNNLTTTAIQNRPLYGARFSPDGRWVATSGAVPGADIWDALTGEQSGVTLPENGVATMVQFDSSGRRVLVAGDSGVWRLWDLAGDELLRPPWHFTQSVWGARFSPDGKLAGIATGNGHAFLLDARDGRLTSTGNHPAGVYSIAFSPDGTMLATGDSDGNGRVWDVQPGPLNGRLLKHKLVINHLGFSPDGSMVVTASGDRTARVWDARTGLPLTDPLLHDYSVWTATFDPAGKHVVTASLGADADRGGAILFWEVASGKLIGRAMDIEERAVTARFGPDNVLLVATGPYGKEPGFAGRYRFPEGDPIGSRLMHGDAVDDLAWSPDGRFIATASEDMTARIWRADTGEPVVPPMYHDRTVWRLAYERSGRLLITAGHEGTVKIWDTATGELVGPALLTGRPLRDVSVSPDGTRIVAASGEWEGPGAVHFWELRSATNSIAQLTDLASLLSGRRISPTGMLEELPPEEQAALWQRLKRDLPEQFQASPQATDQWHIARAEAADIQHDQAVRRFHLRQVQIHPRNELFPEKFRINRPRVDSRQNVTGGGSPSGLR